MAWVVLACCLLLTPARATTPLVQLSPKVYTSEHVVFIIDASLPWSDPTAVYNALYVGNASLPQPWPNLYNYFNTTTAQFPGTYFAMVYMANTGANIVPSWITRQFKATGLHQIHAVAGAPQEQLTVDFCRYTSNMGTATPGFLGVLDHELGHAWATSVLAPELTDGHWAKNSTIECQMSNIATDDNGVTNLMIFGDPVHGFRWQRKDNVRVNQYDPFSEQTLYLAGMRAEWPTTYLLNSPVYNADLTLSSASVTTFDHQTMVTREGVRNPDYKTSQKRFKVGFIYIARDLAEVNAVNQAIEASAAFFSEAEEVVGGDFLNEVPFLCDTRFRGSIEGRYTDLDGNPTPTLALASGYVTSSDGSASVGYTAGVASGSAPTVSVVPASTCASISGGAVQFSGLPDGVHFFTIKAGTSAGKKTFAHVTVEVARPAGSVTITSSPADQYATALGDATFNVSAITSGSGALSYQWFCIPAYTSTCNLITDADTAYSGTTTAALTVHTTAGMDGDQFLCLVSDGSSTATSNHRRDTINTATGTELLIDTTPAMLHVNELAPLLTAQPASLDLRQGIAATFSTASTGGPARFGYDHYQWQLLPAGSATWANLTNDGTYTGATSTDLHVMSTLAMSGNQYRCVVSNTMGSATSSSASLTVGSGPAITAQPVTTYAAIGGSGTLSVTATGTAPLTYTWYKLNTPIANSNSPTLTISKAQSGDAGVYSVSVSNAYDSTQSNGVNLVVEPVLSLSLALSDRALDAGQSVAITATLAASNPALIQYQWTFNGSPISGASGTSFSTNFSHTVTNFQAADAGTYTLTLTNDVSTISTSSTFVLKVPLVINTQPQSLTVATGSSASFTVAATGTAPMTYSWYGPSPHGWISGASSATYLIAAAAASDAGSYYVDVYSSSTYSLVRSSTVTLAVLDPPAITAQPQSVNRSTGQATTLSVTATGGGTLAYQWSKDGSPISGATSSTLGFTNLQPGDGGGYTVAVTNAVGGVTSAAAVLAVSNAPAITAQPQALGGYVGLGASFTVSAAGGGTIAYQWIKDASPLSGATSSTLSLSNLQASDAGGYTVTVSSEFGSVTSDAAALTVSKRAQVLSFAKPANRPYTATPFSLTASSDAGLSVSFSVVSGNASVEGGSLTLTGTGMITVRASQTGDATWLTAADVDQTFTVWQALTGTATGTAPLVQLGTNLYLTEHVLFVIDASVPWSNPTAAYDAIYGASPAGTANWPGLSKYFDAITAQFPGTYFAMTYTANSGLNPVPNWTDRIFKAEGINEPGTPGAPQSYVTVDFCRYNLYGGNINKGALGVLDHEIGHAWGAQVFYPLGSSHWSQYSTIHCQLGGRVSDDGGLTGNKIFGTPAAGFRWQREDNNRYNHFNTFSDQLLYLAGMAAKWPTTYLLNTAVFNADLTMSYASVETYDHARMLSTHGARNPDYTTSQKRFRMGFVYIARDLAEVNTVAATMEQSAAQFCEGDEIDTVNFGSQVPFVCDTKFRGSLNGRLADLDGNPTPTLVLGSGHVTSTDGSASVAFTAGVSVGPDPVVSVVPASTCAAISGGSVVFSGLPDGVHFFTIRAQTPAGKRTYAHVAVDVARPAGTASITTPPADQFVTALGSASFTVGAATSGPGSLTYQWFRIASGGSTCNALSDTPGVYSGCATATLTVQATTAMDNDQFLCLVGDGSSSATGTAALLKVNELAPQLTSQPSDATLPAGNTAHFIVASAGAPSTFGYDRYQWQRKPAGTGTWSDLASAGAYSNTTATNLSVTSTIGMNGDQFRCLVTNTMGSTTSAAGTLTIGSVPLVTSQPVSLSVANGATATFTVTASGTGPLSYSWSKNGTAITGANASTLTLSNVQDSDGAYYRVVVTSDYGSATSNSVLLTVQPTAPSITSQPVSLQVATNASFSFSVTATGTIPFTYQWKKEGANIAGANGASYSVPSAQTTSVATYTVTVSNAAGSVTSAPATLMLTGAPSITTQPVSQVITSGGTATFSVRASGSPTLNYQWKKDGVNVGAKVTYYTYLKDNALVADAGTYTAVVSNVYGWATSNPVTLTVNKKSQTISFAGPASQAFSFTPITLSAASNATLPVTFSLVSGAASLTGSALTLTGTGSVTVRASQAGDADTIAAVDVDRSFSISANFDSWRLAHFTTSELADSSRSGGAAIYSADGLNNLMKYALGLEPKTAVHTGLPLLTRDAAYYIFTYTRPAGIADITYSPQISTDLVTWTATGVTQQLLSSSGGTDTWRANYPVASAPRVFFRLVVTGP